MKVLQKIKNCFKLFSVKRDEAIYTCIKNDIELTDKNITEVKLLIKQKEEIKKSTISNTNN